VRLVKTAVFIGPHTSPAEAASDALARELKLKTNGKQMLAALEKAGLI